MFRDIELSKALIPLIEDKQFDKVIDLIATQPLSLMSQRASWFHKHYNESRQPDNWLKLWEKILDKEWPKSSFMEFTIKDIIARAVTVKDQALLIKTIDTPEYQSIALTLLAKDHENTELLLDILRKIKPQEKQLAVYEQLIKLSFEKYNAPLLQELNRLSEPFNFSSCAIKLQDQGKLIKLLTMTKEKAQYVNKKMAAFVNGYGNIKHNDALLTLAQVKKRKKHKYDYEPILYHENPFLSVSFNQ